MKMLTVKPASTIGTRSTPLADDRRQIRVRLCEVVLHAADGLNALVVGQLIVLLAEDSVDVRLFSVFVQGQQSERE